MARRQIPQSIGMSRVLSRFIHWAAQAPEGAGDYAVHSLILLTRTRLGMTQAQLAKRCGLPQSHIAKIEKGKVDVQLTTLRRIFKALFCRLVVAPKPDRDLNEIIREQTRKAALKRVKRVAGTMAMEKQRPEEGMLDDLVRAETERLLQKRSSEIWELE
ncbi:MAG: helix-turn-helix domain-containing protein [Elusimicrobiota bacterium]